MTAVAADVAEVLAGRARWCLLHGEAVVWMRLLAFTFGRFARAVVTDPPYHLTTALRGGSPRTNDEATPFGRTRLGSPAPAGSTGFMGKTWDGGDVAHRVETWEAALMCCKPGAYLVAASGTRTYHRLACAVEDAGWEIGDMLGWIHAQGMAKTGDVSKRIDKAAGATRRVTGRKVYAGGHVQRSAESIGYGGCDPSADTRAITAPASADAAAWEGHSESLAPSIEPMVLARAPFRGSSAANLVANGCGALNVDAGRIGSETITTALSIRPTGFCGGGGVSTGNTSDHVGRWPKNVALAHSEGCKRAGSRKVRGFKTPVGHDTPTTGDVYGAFAQRSTVDHTDVDGMESVEVWRCAPGCAVAALDAQAGNRVSSPRPAGQRAGMGYHGASGDQMPAIEGSEGNASRYYFQSKAAASERWCLVTCACGRRPMRRTRAKRLTHRVGDATLCRACKAPATIIQHATVKPLDLDRWIARLVVPPRAAVVVPFAGTASEMIAVLEARPDARVIGIEMERDHFDIALARLQAWDRGDRDEADAPGAVEVPNARQPSLFGGTP